jgi:phage protein D
MALSKTTQDHDEIRQWAEARGAKPAEVASTEHNGETGIIRLEFPRAPHHNDSSLKEISWDEFFEKFDASGLAFTYQDVTSEGEQSNFNKLVYPEDAKTHSSGSSSKNSTKSSTGSSTGKSTGASSSSSHKKTASKQSGSKSSKQAS